MYAIVRETKVKPGNMDRIVRTAREELVEKFDRINGFIGYSIAVPNDTLVVTTGFFADKKGAEESTQVAREWVNKHFADVVEGPPQVTEGSVVVSDRIPDAPVGYGVMRKGTWPGGAEASAQKIREGLIPLLRSVAGYASYALVDVGGNAVVTLVAFKDKTAADEGAKVGPPWVEKNLPDATLQSTTQAEIKLRHVNEEAAAAAAR